MPLTPQDNAELDSILRGAAPVPIAPVKGRAKAPSLDDEILDILRTPTTPPPPQQGFFGRLKEEALGRTGFGPPPAELTKQSTGGQAAAAALGPLIGLAGSPLAAYSAFREATRPLTPEEQEGGVRRDPYTHAPINPIEKGLETTLPFVLGQIGKGDVRVGPPRPSLPGMAPGLPGGTPPQGLPPSQMKPRPPGPPGQYVAWTTPEGPPPAGIPAPRGPIPLPEVAGPSGGPKVPITWTDLTATAKQFESPEAFKSYLLRTPDARAKMRQHPSQSADQFWQEARKPPEAAKPAPEPPPTPKAEPEAPAPRTLAPGTTRMAFTSEAPEIQPLRDAQGSLKSALADDRLRRSPEGHYELTDAGIRFLEAKGPEFGQSIQKIQDFGKAVKEQTGRAMPPGKDLEKLFGIEMETPGAPQATPRKVEAPPAPAGARPEPRPAAVGATEPAAAPPRFEKTPEGMQGVIADTPKHEAPSTALKAKGQQTPLEESPLFGQAKAARERAADASQGELDPQRAAVQEYLADQLGATYQMALSQAKSPKAIPPALRLKLKDLGLTPEEAWDLSHAEVPRHAVIEKLLGMAIEKPALPSKARGAGAIEKLKGDISRAEQDIRRLERIGEKVHPQQQQRLEYLKGELEKRQAKFFGAGKQGFEHGVPNLDNPKDLYQIVRGAGGVKVGEDLAGELRAIPTWAKNKNGRSLDSIAEGLADEYPHLGDRAAIKEKIADGLSRYDLLKGEAKGKAQAAEQAASMPPPEDPMALEIRNPNPPADVQIAPGEWTIMDPGARKAFLEYMRGIFDNETGALDFAKMMKTLHRWRKRFPMEEAVRKAMPNSPVIAETERWTTGLSDGISRVSEQPWWKGVRKMSPDALKDLEEHMINTWIAGGRTPRAAGQARALAPPHVQQAMAWRDRALRLENASRRYFGLEEIPEESGPYLPRMVDEESLDQVTLGAGALGGRGRGPQTTVGPHQKRRGVETYRQGEALGLEYEDPRNSILLREWQGIKLRATHRLFQNLESKGALFRDEAQAQAMSPTGNAWKIKQAPGGEWWTPTEAEAQFLQQNLTESARGPQTSLVGYANAVMRNPNLVNPAPHVVKNMAIKAFLARGPVTPYVLARDAVEYFRSSNPQLLREFHEGMPFSKSGEVAADVLGRELRSGSVMDAVRKALRTLGQVQTPSKKVIFEWADPAMRYSLFKHYRGKGMPVYEAANNAWVDLIRYGTRSKVTDNWKAWPFNFFVPWRYGTFVSLVKQVQNHPIRTALLIAGVDYLREARYRQNGRWFHLPWDYIEAPIARIVQSKDKEDFARNALSEVALTSLFGPGGAFAASQIDDMLRLSQGKSDPYEYERLAKMFWGIGQLYDVFISDKPMGGASGALGALLLGEHNTLTYQPKRLGPGFGLVPESVLQHLPGMQKSRLVQEAEEMQAEREAKRQRSLERRREKGRPRGIEDKLRDAGLLK